MGENIELRLGAFSPPVGEQLRDQFPTLIGTLDKELSILDRAAKDVAFLMVQGFLSEAETHKARMRIIKEAKSLVKAASHAKKVEASHD